MQKPKEPRLSTGGAMDYDLAERALRQLQDSHLHVFWTTVFSALPEALKTGGPDDEHTSIGFDLALLTDGRRGWLVLVNEVPEYDAAAELTDLFEHLLGGPSQGLVVRAANMSIHDPCVREKTLRLESPRRVRAELEAAYETAFGAGNAVDHDVLLERLRAYGFGAKDEREMRRWLSELGAA
jgi:hypothetical protein